VAARLVQRVPDLWLSRSWTTRPPRSGERQDAYEFVDRPAFMSRVEAGGFLEWAEFLDDLYGTPVPDPPPGADVLLEIDLQGARQVLARHPDAVVVLLVPPSTEVEEERLRARGDPEDRVRERVALGRREERIGREMTPHVVVNDDLDRAVEEVADIVEAARAAAGTPPFGEPESGHA
jgi:guanylate kinase